MKTIINGDEKIWDFIGYQTVQASKYRPLYYCVEVSVDDGVLVFNQITKQMIHMEPIEYTTFYNSTWAISNWFSVPQEFDEQELVKKIRLHLSNRSIVPNDIYLYHIFTTSACNARCAYCFEKGNQHCGAMNERTAAQVAKYILNRKPKNQEVLLAWFGGEPLLNISVIDKICSILNETNFDYHSIMATNAFLINDDIIYRAKSIWKLRTWNITLDGTEHVYNQTKNYITKCDSPFRKVVSNIGKLLKAGFRVNIRLNLGVHNNEDLTQLVDNIYTMYGVSDNLCVYATTLYERQLEMLLPRPIEEEISIRQKEKELYDKVVSLGLYKPRLNKEFKVYRCNPDMGWAVSILPDGRVGWCEDYVDKYTISHISSNEFDINTIQKFKERFDDLAECASCPLYPDCIRLKRCDIDTPWCTLQKREVQLHKIRTAMQMEYKHSLSKFVFEADN